MPFDFLISNKKASKFCQTWMKMTLSMYQKLTNLNSRTDLIEMSKNIFLYPLTLPVLFLPPGLTWRLCRDQFGFRAAPVMSQEPHTGPIRTFPSQKVQTPGKRAEWTWINNEKGKKLRRKGRVASPGLKYSWKKKRHASRRIDLWSLNR